MILSRSTTCLSALVLALGLVASSQAQTVVTFQQGVDGYTGCFDRLIDLNNSRTGSEIDTTTANFFIDGDPDDPARADYLIRFEGIVGGSAIPANAIILDATLTLTTTSEAVSTNSRTGESYNVYHLLQPFDENSVLDGDFGDMNFAFTPFVDGVEPEDGEADLNVGTFDHPIGDSGLEPDLPYAANVTRAVQAWVNGGVNNGIAVCSDHTDNDDGWSVHTTGSSDVTTRPILTVTYIEDPELNVIELQQGLAGYTGTTDVFLRETDVSIDGATVSEGFLDGSNGTNSFDDPYLVQFDLAGLPQISEIVSAELIFKTGISNGASDTPGPFNVHQMLVPFTPSSQYGDFSGFAADMESAGEIGPQVVQFLEMDEAELVGVDVKSVVENWVLNGQDNYGFYVGPGTSNGWQIFSSGAADADLAPMLRLVVRVVDFVPGDMNDDGTLNTLDLSAFILAILDINAYNAMYPNVDAVQRGDYSGDGALNTLDLAGFIDDLLN